MKVSLAALAVASLIIASPLHAADGHKHAEAKPKQGGMIKEVDEVTYELVAKPDRLTVYVEDHGKKVDSAGLSGKVTLRTGADRVEAPLAPAGENKLVAVGSFKVGAGTTAIVQVKRAGKPEASVRFNLK